jgi:hypothetical protein
MVQNKEKDTQNNAKEVRPCPEPKGKIDFLPVFPPV